MTGQVVQRDRSERPRSGHWPFRKPASERGSGSSAVTDRAPPAAGPGRVGQLSPQASLTRKRCRTQASAPRRREESPPVAAKSGQDNDRRDSRVNIPTAETRSLAANEEQGLQTLRRAGCGRAPGSRQPWVLPSYWLKPIRIMLVKITMNPTSSSTTTSLTRAVSASSWTVAVPSALTGAAFIL
jgi:hypothetical protein